MAIRNPSGDVRLKAVRKVPKIRPAEVDVKTLTIDRANWLMGEWERFDSHRSMLRHPVSGMMCCLGFFCKKLGLKDSEITSIYAPQAVRTLLPTNQQWLTEYGNNSAIERLMEANDDDTDRKDREKRIIAGFAEQGITVKFKGRYPTAAQVERMING